MLSVIYSVPFPLLAAMLMLLFYEQHFNAQFGSHLEPVSMFYAT